LEEHLQGFWLGSAHNRTDMVGPGLAAGDDNLLRTSWPDIANICYHKNGVDCGPMVVALVDIFLRAGIQYKQVYQVQLPHLECAHKTRARMLEGIKNSHGLWRRLTSNGVKFELAPTDSQLNLVEWAIASHGMYESALVFILKREQLVYSGLCAM